MAKHRILSDGDSVATVELVDGKLAFDTDDMFLRGLLDGVRANGVVTVLHGASMDNNTIIDGVMVEFVGDPKFMSLLASHLGDYGYEIRPVSGVRVKVHV